MSAHYQIAYIDEAPTGTMWLAIEPARLTNYLWEAEHSAVYRPETEARLCWTNEALHVRFHCYEENPVIRHTDANSPVYLDSCVEFFVLPMPEHDPRYLNFEFNAAGTMLLGRGVDRNDREMTYGLDPARFSIVAERELADAAGRAYWALTFRIPFDWLAELYPGFSAAPGQTMRGNFYKCESDAPQPHYLSWSHVDAPTPNFHLSAYFGSLAFR